MPKFDYMKDLKELYKPSANSISELVIPEMWFLKIDGKGDPNHSEQFSTAVEAHFSLSYAVKFFIKKNLEMDYRVFPLEGLWWADDMSDFSADTKEDWKWTLMIAQPTTVTEEIISDQAKIVSDQKNIPLMKHLRFEPYDEGVVCQIMHIGPFSEEGPTIEKLHRHINNMGAEFRGKHHEIYLSDIRKGNPANWKTVIRQPINI